MFLMIANLIGLSEFAAQAIRALVFDHLMTVAYFAHIVTFGITNVAGTVFFDTKNIFGNDHAISLAG